MSKEELTGMDKETQVDLNIIGGESFEFYQAEMRDLTYLFLKQRK
jgi:hypothetical protein